MPSQHASAGAFKGNKKALPSKICVACQRTMTWRKRWARHWEEVKYCSEACRKAGPRSQSGNPPAR
jgi:hypothetical protein